MIKNKKIAFITRAGVIAALYAALTILLHPISFGAVQLRVSEALRVLPFFFREAVPGLFIGCIVSNLFSPNIVILDVVFGSLATLLAAVCTRFIRIKWLAPLPPVIFNALIVGAVITFSTTNQDGFAAAFAGNAVSVGIGEFIVCYGLGLPLMFAIWSVSHRQKTVILRENRENREYHHEKSQKSRDPGGGTRYAHASDIKSRTEGDAPDRRQTGDIVSR